MGDAQEGPAPAAPALRIADADREAAAERLREAVAVGRLELAELDERLSAVYAAKTRADLDPLTADLPAEPAAARPGVEAPPLTLETKSGMLKRDGYWQVPDRITAECTSGRIKLDFTAAECPHREVSVEAHAKSGSVVLVVPRGWWVNLDEATASSGTVVNKVKGPPASGAPGLRVSGEVRSGTIRARHPRRSFWAWLLRRPA
ncbi:DUF1707 domain-containing protein [Streptomonospora wellingtoniae]|uniref:DUF1707 domain-containing protein n=1 Tax=Streptomonospora wellingtoniae TaxID=3075544 RepID=A0ABU2KN83_9ACTN|nr:DUF1707 domain-containing protein [Streptomonospora sp. DSM 45055]MDT0300726.1 DUF1707 domain-containing protein [Streptomonospora sp. DSM 45055]